MHRSRRCETDSCARPSAKWACRARPRRRCSSRLRPSRESTRHGNRAAKWARLRAASIAPAGHAGLCALPRHASSPARGRAAEFRRCRTALCRLRALAWPRLAPYSLPQGGRRSRPPHVLHCNRNRSLLLCKCDHLRNYLALWFTAAAWPAGLLAFCLAGDFLQLDRLTKGERCPRRALLRIAECAAVFFDTAFDRTQKLALPVRQFDSAARGRTTCTLQGVQGRTFCLFASIRKLFLFQCCSSTS